MVALLLHSGRSASHRLLQWEMKRESPTTRRHGRALGGKGVRTLEQRNAVPSKPGVVSGPLKEPKSLAVGMMTPDTSARLVRNLNLPLASTDKTKQTFIRSTP